MSEARQERVALPGRETEIEIVADEGAGLAPWLERHVGEGARAAFVLDSGLARAWPALLPAGWPRPGDLLIELVGGEAAKTREVLADLQDHLVALTREDCVVAFGGGAVLDVAGFAAATARRGMPWLAVPSTVVAMADASVGGKVAINHPAGKNLLGAFHPPRAVRADVGLLRTLDPRDRVAGLAELYKCARLGDAELLASLRSGAPGSAADWAAAMHAAIRIKARLVEQDERDGGVRRLLNLGHTLGHALERVSGFGTLKHGEAVAIGMVQAVALAAARGLVAEDEPAVWARDLERLGLPVALPAGVDTHALIRALDFDKKRAPGRAHTFILPTGETSAAVHADVRTAEIEAVLGASA